MCARVGVWGCVCVSARACIHAHTYIHVHAYIHARASIDGGRGDASPPPTFQGGGTA